MSAPWTLAGTLVPGTQGRGLPRCQGRRSALTDAVGSLGHIDTNESATPRRASRGVARAVGLLMLIGSGVSPIERVT